MDILRGIFVGVIATVIGGMIVFNLTKPEPPLPALPQIEVVRKIISVPVRSGEIAKEAGLGWLVSKGWKEPEDPFRSARDWINSSFYSGYLIQQFEITNIGERIYKDVTVKLPGFAIATSEFQGVTARIQAIDNKYTLTPKESVVISVLSDGTALPSGDIYGDGKIFISIDDIPIPIKDWKIERNNNKLAISDALLGDASFSWLLLLLYIFVGTSIFTIASAVHLLTLIYPRANFWIIDEKSYGKMLALVDVFRERLPDRYTAIKKVADAQQPALLAIAPESPPQRSVPE